MKEDTKLIFLHLPKTGGLTLRAVIVRNYAPGVVHTIDGSPGSVGEFVGLPERRRREIRVLQGHMPFGLHAHLGDGARYVTMLRHPVERVVSLYYYVRQTPENPLHGEVTRGRMSLDDFVESGTPQVSNHQTRLVAGREEDFTEAALASAKENLRASFAAVGLAERFDESLILFRRLLGWERIHYVKGNVTKNRPRRDDISASTIKLIENRNALDVELYDFARRRFEELVGARDASHWREVRAFRRSNSVYVSLMGCYDAARRATPSAVRTAVRRVVRG